MSKSAPAQPVKLTTRATLDCTMNAVKEHFDLSADGYVCDTHDVWQVVLTAAARRSTIEAACADLLGAPDSNTIRGYLNAQLPPAKIPALQAACNAALAGQLPDWLKLSPQEVACDLHDTPYYGQQQPQDPQHPEADPDYWVCRGEARNGTTRFYRCATAYVMRQGVRMNLAVRFVHPGDPLAAVLHDLLERVQALGITIGCLHLDKGFCGIPTLRFLLTQPHLAVIMAAPIRGKKGGLRALCQGRRSYRTTHTFRSAPNGALTVPVGVVRTFVKRRDGRWVLQWLVYVLLNLADAPLRRVRKRYRRRFGIESSYRLLEQVRARTTSNHPAVRFLFMGVAVLILNIWIALHWRFLRRRGCGPRRVAREHFTLDRMAHFLSRAVEAIYGVVSVVDPPGVKPVIY
jgi:putative transposase